MPRAYKRKTEREVDEINMKNAISAYLKEELGINASAQQHNVKRTTLQSRVKLLLQKNSKEDVLRHLDDSGNENEEDSYRTKYGNKYSSCQIFSLKEEKELASYIKHCSNLNYGLTYHQIQKLAYEYATTLGRKMPKTWENKEIAGDEWRKGFMNRNKDLSLRKPESTSLWRGTGFNKARVDEFFGNLSKILEKYRFKPEQIFNLNETGISTVVKPVKVVSTKGKKQVGQVASGERGETVTFVGIINALGTSLPPVFVFPRQRNIEEYLTEGPSSSMALGNKSGWMTSELFVKVLWHIVHHTKCSNENKILLLIDNHESHTSVDAIVLCRKNGIILLSFPPHTTHRLQPLDVGVYGPFKSKLSIAQNDWMLSNPGRIITVRQIAKITNFAFLAAFTPSNIVNSFKNTGIWPINRQLFTEDDFISSSVTDKPIRPEHQCTSNAEASQTDSDHSQPSTSTANLNETPTTSKSNIQPASSHVENNNNGSVQNLQINNDNNASILEKIRPFPKIDNNEPKKRKRKVESKSRIYTDSPELAMKQNLELERQRKKKVVVGRTKRKVLQDSSSSDSEISVQNADSSDESFSSLEIIGNDGSSFNLHEFVLVKVLKTSKKKEYCYYIGKIVDIGEDLTISFLRRRGKTNNFNFPIVEEKQDVPKDDIVAKLSIPNRTGTARTLSSYRFNYKFEGYDLR